MTMPAQRKAPNADTAMKRTDVVRLLQEGGNPEQLDVSNHDLHGINLLNGNVRGADLSWACFGEASDSEQLKHQLWRRGAIFRETTNVRVAGRFSGAAGRHALGFALGFILTSVVGFLCMFGLRILLVYLRLKRNEELERVASRSGCV